MEQAQAYLSSDVDGNNLFEHLTSVLCKILQDKPENALAAFESISKEIKQSKFTVADSEMKAEVPDDVVSAANNRVASLAPLDDADADSVQSLFSDKWLLDYAGASLGNDAFCLQSHMVKLTAKAGASNVRFWGKINGVKGDYFVFESNCVAADSAEGADSPGSGGNLYSYWALSTLTGEVSELPLVSHETIVAARSIRKYFTGDLNCAITSYPPFPGTEKEYLRATIALISSDCTLAISGSVETSDDGEIVAAEEPSYGDNFDHAYTGFNNYGMTAVVEDEELAENYPEQSEPRKVEAINEEEWSTRTFANNKVIVAKSLKWQGASTVRFGERAVNVYIGYGCSTSEETYSPPPPPAMQKQFENAEDEEKTFSIAADNLDAPVEEKEDEGEEGKGDDEE